MCIPFLAHERFYQTRIFSSGKGLPKSCTLGQRTNMHIAATSILLSSTMQSCFLSISYWLSCVGKTVRLAVPIRLSSQLADYSSVRSQVSKFRMPSFFRVKPAVRTPLSGLPNAYSLSISAFLEYTYTFYTAIAIRASHDTAAHEIVFYPPLCMRTYILYEDNIP